MSYLLVVFPGSIILFFVLETKSTEDGICTMWHARSYECVKTTRSDVDGYVIPATVSLDAQGVQLTKGESKAPWIINDVNYFLRYSELLELAIAGPVLITKNLTETISKTRELQDNLFYLPKVKLISCLGCDFNHFYHMWRLPWEIARLVFADNQYQEFNFTYSPYLIEINFERNRLTRMPHWVDKPSPLEELYLLNNPDLRITFDDIAMFCELTALSMDAGSDHYITQHEQSCDCYMIRKWINEFEIRLTVDKMSLGPTDGNALKCYKIANCPKHRAEEFAKKKEYCTNRRKLRIPSYKHKLPFRPNKKFRKMVFIMVFVVFSSVAGALLLYVRSLPPPRRSEDRHRRRVRDHE